MLSSAQASEAQSAIGAKAIIPSFMAISSSAFGISLSPSA
jgi:hypothetical protein